MITIIFFFYIFLINGFITSVKHFTFHLWLLTLVVLSQSPLRCQHVMTDQWVKWMAEASRGFLMPTHAARCSPDEPLSLWACALNRHRLITLSFSHQNHFHFSLHFCFLKHFCLRFMKFLNTYSDIKYLTAQRWNICVITVTDIFEAKKGLIKA